VLLFTNDGDLAKRLMHPSFKKKKIYHVYLDKALKTTDFQTLMDGIQLEDGPIAADAMSYVSQEDKKQVGLEIHSGRNRIVRRMFEHLGYTVERLDRVYFAGMTKKQLGRGKWRYLTNKEIAKLKMDAFV
jgi:23S rRNA pseudouridine2605 synthase